jgi:iron complex transport system permease protein
MFTRTRRDRLSLETQDLTFPDLVRPWEAASCRERLRAWFRDQVRLVILFVGLVVLAVISLGLGRYPIDPFTVLRILIGQVFGTHVTWSAVQQTVILQVRLPRILAGLLVGAALSSSGAAYQVMFRNPLVSPDILGVSAGAGFGASVAILAGVSSGELQLLSFICGLLAAALAVAIGRTVGRGSLVVLVLGGVVVAAMFNALISATQYFANPETTLPEITFWLFGSLARATMGSLVVPGVIVGVCLVALYLVRWPLTVLATGDDEARSLGVNRKLVWTVAIVSSTLMTATVVSLAGIIGWVGLVVPHLGRFLVGPSFNRLLPVSIVLGAGYLLAVDDVARSATSLDLPIGILTALIGAPFFVLMLVKAGRRWL